MRYSEFGRTGRNVSVVGLGGAQFGIYNQKLTIEQGAEIIKHALKSGINYFDTAPWYHGPNVKSEMVFGEGLRGLDRSSFYIATKVGRYEHNILKMFDFSAEKTEASVKESLENLQLNYIDCVQIHDMEYADNIDQILTETLPTLERLKQRDQIKHIGIASYHLPKTKYILERSPVPIDSVLNHSCMTLIEQTLRDYVGFIVKEKGLGLVHASPLAHGLLINRPLPDFVKSRADRELTDASRQAVECCNQEGKSIERLAIGYSAHEGEKIGVNVLLTGADSKLQLDANIKTICDGLTPEDYELCRRLHFEYFAGLKSKNWINNEVIAVKEKLKAAKAGKHVTWP